MDTLTAGTFNEVVYHLTQSDVENAFTLLSGLVTVNLFLLLTQLLCLGVLLVVVFSITVRKF